MMMTEEAPAVVSSSVRALVPYEKSVPRLVENLAALFPGPDEEPRFYEFCLSPELKEKIGTAAKMYEDGEIGEGTKLLTAAMLHLRNAQFAFARNNVPYFDKEIEKRQTRLSQASAKYERSLDSLIGPARKALAQFRANLSSEVDLSKVGELNNSVVQKIEDFDHELERVIKAREEEIEAEARLAAELERERLEAERPKRQAVNAPLLELLQKASVFDNSGKKNRR